MLESTTNVKQVVKHPEERVGPHCTMFTATCTECLPHVMSAFRGLSVVVNAGINGVTCQALATWPLLPPITVHCGGVALTSVQLRAQTL
jgi:hypothetical protein